MTEKSRDISRHILPVSSTMVGVCMTVITVLQLAPKNSVSSWADNLMAIDSLFFLGSTMLSYWSLRTERNAVNAEVIADRLFIIGMIGMVLVSFLVAFELFID
ncbi:MAG: hypothetical protein WC733_06140 [Methylophilus sp.]